MDGLFKAGFYLDMVDKFSAPMRAAERVLVSAKRNFATFPTTAIENKLTSLSTRFDDVGSRLIRQGQALQTFGRDAMQAGLVTGAAFAIPIKAAADFETAMMGVGKQMDLDIGTKGFQDMSNQILNMSKEIPISVKGIAQIAESGAKMGVGSDKIIKFTQNVSKMSSALNLSAENTATSMGKIAGIFNLNLAGKDFTQLGDTINFFDDKLKTTAGDILEVLNRTSGLGKQAGFTANQMTALGASILDLGESPETASTALNDLMGTLMMVDVETDKSQKALRRLGFNPEAFKGDFMKNPMNALDVFMKKVRDTGNDASSNLALILGKEPTPKLLKLVDKWDTIALRMRQVDSGRVMMDGKMANILGGVDKEFERQSKTFNSQFQLMQNSANILAIRLGSALLPQLNQLVQNIAPVVDKVAAWIEANPQLTGTIMKLVGGFAVTSLTVGALSMTFGKAFTAVGGLVRGFGWLAGTNTSGIPRLLAFKNAIAGLGGTLTRAATWFRGLSVVNHVSTWFSKLNIMGRITPLFARLGGVLRGGFVSALRIATTAFRAFSLSMLTNPITLAIGGIAVAGYLIYKNWDKVKAFFAGFWEGIQPTWNAMKPVFAALGNAFKPLTSALGKLWGWFKSLLPPMGSASDIGRKLGQIVGVFLVGNIQKAVGAVRSFVIWTKQTWQTLKGFATSVYDAGVKMLTSLANGIKGGIGRATSAISAVWNAIKGTVSNWGSMAWNWGKSLLDGIARGIRAGIDGAWNAMASAANRLKSGFTSLLGIQSPSRVFASYGGYMMRGLEGGIVGGMGRAVKATKAAAKAVSIAGVLTFPTPVIPMPKMPKMPMLPMPTLTIPALRYVPTMPPPPMREAAQRPHPPQQAQRPIMANATRPSVTHNHYDQTFHIATNATDAAAVVRELERRIPKIMAEFEAKKTRTKLS